MESRNFSDVIYNILDTATKDNRQHGTPSRKYLKLTRCKSTHYISGKKGEKKL